MLAVSIHLLRLFYMSSLSGDVLPRVAPNLGLSGVSASRADRIHPGLGMGSLRRKSQPRSIPGILAPDARLRSYL